MDIQAFLILGCIRNLRRKVLKYPLEVMSYKHYPAVEVCAHSFVGGRILKGRLILFLSSLLIASISIYLTHTKYESLVIYSYGISGGLAVINMLANILDIIDYLRSTSESSDLKVNRGKNIFTPLYLDVGKITQHLEKFEPTEIDTAVWHEKTKEYLFLSSKRKIRTQVTQFVRMIEEYNALCRRLKTTIHSFVSSQFYEYCEGIAVPPSDPNGYGFDSRFYKLCKRKGKQVVARTFQILLKKNASSLNPSERYVVERPLRDLLSEGDAFAFYIQSVDLEEIEEKLVEYTDAFSKKVFAQLFDNPLLKTIQQKRIELIKEAKELHEFLASEIEKSV